MQTVTEPTVTRPFHETIVGAIQRCSNSSNGEIRRLFQLIKETKIPKGHDEIITAIDEFFDSLGGGGWADDIHIVKKHILAQKQASVKKPDDEKKGINLNDLQEEIEKLLALLNDRQSGFMTWHEFMRERLQNLHELTSQALGK